jgi:uncharacterized protein involved in exopolysaccharide biosynthesis
LTDAPRSTNAVGEVGLLELAGYVLRRWKLIAAVPLVLATVTALIVLLLPPVFTASTAFMPEVSGQNRLPSGLAGIAGQFGISLGADGQQSAQFYASVLRSPEIMNRVLVDRFVDPRPGARSDSATLLELLEIEGDSLAEQLHSGRKAMQGRMSTSIDHQTNIVTLSIQSEYPLLASVVANRFIAFLHEFNATARQSQARERRRFTESRLTEARRELLDSESAVMRFYERNRTWQQSPQLTFEHERLQRQVRITQEVTLTLQREYEAARIAEVNDTPVLTVLYPATPPQEKTGPRRRLMVMLMFVVGGFLGVMAALATEYTRSVASSNPGHAAALRESYSSIRHELRRLLRVRDL